MKLMFQVESEGDAQRFVVEIGWLYIRLSRSDWPVGANCEQVHWTDYDDIAAAFPKVSWVQAYWDSVIGRQKIKAAQERIIKRTEERIMDTYAKEMEAMYSDQDATNKLFTSAMLTALEQPVVKPKQRHPNKYERELQYQVQMMPTYVVVQQLARSCNVTCRECGTGGFRWLKVDDRWLLFTPKGNLHVCSKRELTRKH